MNNKVFKTLVFNKDAGVFTSEGRAGLKNDYYHAPLKRVRSLAGKINEGFNRHQVKSHDRERALFTEIVKGYKAADAKKPLSSKDRKLMEEFEKSIKEMDDDLNTLFTPEELKKYRS